jgi:hypothetical protein
MINDLAASTIMEKINISTQALGDYAQYPSAGDHRNADASRASSAK